MKTMAGSQGKITRMLAGAEAIEIKATIPDAQIDNAITRFNLTIDNDEERYIYFFDSPGLDLLEAGIIARARRTVGADHDSTIKFRPVVPEEVSEDWRKYRGFKIEADASEKGVVKSASFTMPVKKGVIKDVATGKKPIEKLFTKEQEAFLAEMGSKPIDFLSLTVLGPLQANRWQFEVPACPWKLTAELWRREDGARLMEVSIKTPVVQAAAAIGGFKAFLAELGAGQDSNQQSKTQWALGHYAAKVVAANKGAARQARKR